MAREQGFQMWDAKKILCAFVRYCSLGFGFCFSFYSNFVATAIRHEIRAVPTDNDGSDLLNFYAPKHAYMANASSSSIDSTRRALCYIFLSYIKQ